MNFVKIAIALMITMTVTLHSKPTQAGIGAIVAAPVVVTSGLVIAGAGVGVFALDIGTALVLSVVNPNAQYPGGIFSFVFGIPLLGLGLIVLDEGATFQYGPIETKAGKKIGLSVTEIMSFNSEVDQINALASDVDQELKAMGSNKSEDAAALWLEARENISPEAFSALVKVTAELYK